MSKEKLTETEKLEISPMGSLSSTEKVDSTG